MCAFISFFGFYTNMDLIFTVPNIPASNHHGIWFYFDSPFATFFSPIIPKITNNSFVSCSPARQFSSIKCWTTWYVFLWFVSVRPHECNETFPLCGLIACGCESDLIVVLFSQKLCVPVFAESPLPYDLFIYWVLLAYTHQPIHAETNALLLLFINLFSKSSVDFDYGEQRRFRDSD